LCLKWVAGCTGPDISFATSLLARQVARPTEHQWQMALGVVAYLSSARTIGLTLVGKGKKPLEGWVDADLAGCRETRRSIGIDNGGRVHRDNRSGSRDRVAARATKDAGIPSANHHPSSRQSKMRSHSHRSLLRTRGRNISQLDITRYSNGRIWV
jgi:hypothetical protein